VTRLRRFAASAFAEHAATEDRAAGRAALIFAAMLVASPAFVSAQTYVGRTGPAAGRVEVSGGATWTGGYDAGSRAALETRNTTTGTGPLTLFNTDANVLSSPGVEARVGVFLGSRVAVEGLFQYARPVLRARLTDDFEGAAPISADDAATSYLFGGSVLYHFGAGRFVPFVAGGGGYLRQLHEGAAVAVTGPEVHGGAGFKYWLGSARRVGVRVDAQASSRSKSIGFEEKRRIVPSVVGGISYLF
jgi:hypothetical protein